MSAMAPRSCTFTHVWLNFVFEKVGILGPYRDGLGGGVEDELSVKAESGLFDPPGGPLAYEAHRPW
jgi:hypothetical protein